jgi:hypothetical protein
MGKMCPHNPTKFIIKQFTIKEWLAIKKIGLNGRFEQHNGGGSEVLNNNQVQHFGHHFKSGRLSVF